MSPMIPHYFATSRTSMTAVTDRMMKCWWEAAETAADHQTAHFEKQEDFACLAIFYFLSVTTFFALLIFYELEASSTKVITNSCSYKLYIYSCLIVWFTYIKWIA